MNSCLLCGSVRIEVKDSHAAYCDACGTLMNIDSQPLDYAEGGGQNPPDESKRRWRLANGRMRLALIEPFLDRHSNFIDIGCGSGETLEAAEALFSRRTGFDTNPSLITYVRDHSEVTVFNTSFDAKLVQDSPEFGGKVFAASHVLEHLQHPLSLIDAIVGAMRPGDLVYLEVPLHTGQSFCNLGYRWSLWNREHLALYSMRSLDFIAHHAGLKILHRGTRIFARGSNSGRTRLRLFLRSPLLFVKTFLKKGRHSIADLMVADYGCVVLRKP